MRVLQGLLVGLDRQSAVLRSAASAVDTTQFAENTAPGVLRAPATHTALPEH